MAHAVREELAGFAAGLQFGDLPAGLVRFASRCVLDQVGVSLAGPPALTESFVPIDSLAREWSGREESTVLGTSLRLPCPNAVWLNTAYATATSFDAIHKSTMIHLSASLIPALLAVAEMRKSSGRELIAAFVAGAEVGIRVGWALNTVGVYELGFHPTCCAAPFACAVGAGRLLGLDATRIGQAISIAAIQAGGLYLTGGAEAHAANYNLAVAMAAESGVKAAMYAGMGVTGFARTFEHERGFLMSHTRKPDPARLVQGLGTEFALTDLCFKKYSIGIYENTSVEALVRMMGRHGLRAADIERITLKLPPKVLRTAGAPEYPANRQRAYTNPRFILALAAWHGDDLAYNASLFGARGLLDPRVADLYTRIDVEPEPELDEVYPEKKPCIVTIRARSGALFTEKEMGPFRGDPGNPFSDAEVREKFMKLSGEVLDPVAQRRVAARIDELEKVEDVSELVASIG